MYLKLENLIRRKTKTK